MLNLSHFLSQDEKEKEKNEDKMPNISRDKAMENKFLDDLKAKMDQEDEDRLGEIHISDLTYCLLKAYFRRKGYVKEESRESLMVKSIGKSFHEFFEVLKGYVREYEVKRYGVVGTIDMFKDYPIEIKTGRKNIKSIEDINKSYIRQIAYYCLLTNKTTGFLIYIYVVKASIKIFKLDYKDVLESYKKEFFERLEKLKKALKDDDPSILENSNWDWECQACPFRNICLNHKHKSLEAYDDV